MPPLTDFTVIAGLIMGAASSLHCAVMCGGIAGSFTLLAAPESSVGRRALRLAFAQAGRLAAYTAAGALVGATGSMFLGALDRQLAYQVLQWAAAVTLGWIGLSIAGLLPPPGFAVGAVAPLLGQITRFRATRGAIGAVVSGLVWGFLPCSMVYGALFTAALAGTAGRGALLMAGFGLGTLPAVMGVGLGVLRLSQLVRPLGRRTVGIAIAAVGVASVMLALPGGPLCVSH